jgi:SHS2 domain-containing protein
MADRQESSPIFISPNWDPFFEHGADIGIEGRGDTIEAAFERAAAAMFSIATGLADVRPVAHVTIAFEEEDVELALVVWLNALLTEAHMRGLAFGSFRLARRDGSWSGEAWGEPWRDELERGVEVKGATLTMLSVRQDGNEWVARCVVDV